MGFLIDLFGSEWSFSSPFNCFMPDDRQSLIHLNLLSCNYLKSHRSIFRESKAGRKIHQSLVISSWGLYQRSRRFKREMIRFPFLCTRCMNFMQKSLQNKFYRTTNQRVFQPFFSFPMIQPWTFLSFRNFIPGIFFPKLLIHVTVSPRGHFPRGFIDPGPGISLLSSTYEGRTDSVSGKTPTS